LVIEIDIIKHDQTNHCAYYVFEIDTDSDYEGVHIFGTQEHQILSYEVTDCKQDNAYNGLVDRRAVVPF